MYQMKNKSVIKTPHNSMVLPPTSGNKACNTLSQLAAYHVSLHSAQLQHRLWSDIAVTIAATRSFCHVLIIPLSRGVTQKCLLRLGTNRRCIKRMWKVYKRNIPICNVRRDVWFKV